jgi:hypothetical protein
MLQGSPHVNKDATSIIVFILFIKKQSQLLVTKTNKYFNK